MEPGGSTTKIGFVGLGAMGGRIAGRLLASGYQVYGTNRTAAKAEPLIEQDLSSAIGSLLTSARARGYGRRDIAALFSVLGELAGQGSAQTGR